MAALATAAFICQFESQGHMRLEGIGFAVQSFDRAIRTPIWISSFPAKAWPFIISSEVHRQAATRVDPSDGIVLVWTFILHARDELTYSLQDRSYDGR